MQPCCCSDAGFCQSTFQCIYLLQNMVIHLIMLSMEDQIIMLQQPVLLQLPAKLTPRSFVLSPWPSHLWGLKAQSLEDQLRAVRRQALLQRGAD